MNQLLLLCFTVLFFKASDAQHQHRITLDPALRPFYHGVESGDPTPDKVILWTRVTPDTAVTGNIDVYWQVATDVNFTNIVNYGKTIATPENHYCVKVDACGLQPATFYYYMFNALGRHSIVARTKTAPAETANNDSCRFAVVSCASWEHGYFNAYESISNRNDVDAVLHLGDYIYEYATGDFSDNVQGRTYDPPTECTTELGYELRYSQYKLDNQLRRIHQLFPFITVWDDHETANDAWREGAENHTQGTEGNYVDRKRFSTSTYFKWMPIRKPDPLDTIRIFRKLRYGKLLDLVMLDTRLYDRDEQDMNARNDTTRHMMGPVERAWFLQQLSDTSTRWKIIGNQVMFAPLQVFGQPVNADQWDGYNHERTLIQNHILQNNIKDVVILTGDIHTSWCNDVPGPSYNNNTGAGSICVEFVGTSVTSFNSPLPVGQNIIRQLNPHMKYINLTDKGYYILDVKKTKTQADYTYVSRVNQQGATNILGPSYLVNDNQRNLIEATSPVTAPQITSPNPPLLPVQTLPFNKIVSQYITVDENQQAVVPVIPSTQICPAVGLNIWGLPQHGGAITLNGLDVIYQPGSNYFGFDTVGISVCATDGSYCDTFYIYVTINEVRAVDSFAVNINSPETYTACLIFDDAQNVVSITGSATQHGTISITDSCFTYTSDSLFCGTERIVFIGCDANAHCDTVIYNFSISRPITSSTIDLAVNKNSNVIHCLLFNNLLCYASAPRMIKTPSNATFTRLNDTCYRFNPYFNFTGNDTVRFVACDGCCANHCDTITLALSVQDPNAITEESFVVFGLFPNPVADDMTIQYFDYNPGKTELKMMDTEGRIVLQKTFITTDAGLHHFKISTGGIPNGNYLVEISSSQKTYRKKIVKQ